MSVRAWLVGVIVALGFVAGGAHVARARPVRIGRLHVLPWGFRAAHACPTVGCDAGRSGRARGAFPSEAPTRTWRQTTTNPVVDLGHTHPIVLDGELVVVAGVGGVEAFTRGGTQVFHALFGVAATAFVPTVTPADELAIATTRGDVLLVTRDGTVRARARFPGGARGAPLVLADGTIVLGTTDGLVGLDAELTPLFEVPLAGGASGAPSLTRDGRIAVGAGAEVVLTDVEGRLQLRSELGARIDDHLTITADGMMWARVAAGELVALDASGYVRTRSGAGSVGERAPVAAADGTLRSFVRAASGRTALAAFGPTGRLLWQRELDGMPRGLAIDAEGTAIASIQPPPATGPGTTNVAPLGALVAVDARGEVRWRVEVEGIPLGPVVRGDAGALYVLVARERTWLECYTAPDAHR